MSKWIGMSTECDIVDYSRVKILPDGTYEHITDQHQIVDLTENEFQKLNDPANGFTEGRNFRKIASIPVIAEADAKTKGYDLSNRKDLERYLAEHPEYQTVEYLHSKRDPRIIIK